MSSRGREYVLKAAAGFWFAFASPACSEQVNDVGGESHFACNSDDDCDVNSVCVRDSGSSTGKCEPARVVGGSGGNVGAGGTEATDNPGTGGSRGTGDVASGGSTGGVGGGGIGTRPSGAKTPQGAVNVRVVPTPGKTCAHTNAQLSIPLVAGVLEALNCNLDQGCAPDEFVVVDRQPGATVSCSVSPSGSSFNVDVRLLYDGTASGDPSLQFQANGVVSPTGGTVAVSESNSVSGGGGTDSACTVTIDAPRGRIDPGSIWGHLTCQNFRNPSDISETGCTLDAVFLFEGCSG